jgi:hypothetical protein
VTRVEVVPAVALAAIAAAATACTERVELPAAPAAGDGDAGPGGSDARGAGGAVVGVVGGVRTPDARGDARGDLAAASLPGGGIPGCADRHSEMSFVLRLPTMVLAVERSTSMLQQRFSTTPTRLQAVQQILPRVIGTYHGAVAYGYEEFPGRRNYCASACCASPVFIYPSQRNASNIQNALACSSGTSTFTGCFETVDESPSHEALRKCREYFEQNQQRFTTSSGFRNILLITDGEPSCGDRVPDACERAIGEANRANMEGIRVFVIALAEEAARSDCLERLAGAGGSKLYVPTTEAQLSQVLHEIMLETAGRACQLMLTSQPPNPDRVVVWFDGRQVRRDPNQLEGWDFAAGSGNLRISFFGTACDRIRTSMVRDIDVLQFCSVCDQTRCR